MKTVDSKWLRRPLGERFLRATELMEKPSGKVQKRLALGNALICAMTAVAMVLTLLFHDHVTSTDTAIAEGYYSYMQDPDSTEVHTRLFATLIVTNVTGMFLAGCSWLMDGVAVLALLHRLCVTALVFVNAAICYQFWLYSAYLLGIEQEKSRRITRALNVFFAFYSAILVVNLFWPIVFAVGPDGVFQRRGLYPLITACLLIILPPLLHGFTQFEGTKREKKIATAVFAISMVLLLLWHYFIALKGMGDGMPALFNSDQVPLTWAHAAEVLLIFAWFYSSSALLDDKRMSVLGFLGRHSLYIFMFHVLFLEIYVSHFFNFLLNRVGRFNTIVFLIFIVACPIVFEAVVKRIADMIK